MAEGSEPSSPSTGHKIPHHLPKRTPEMLGIRVAILALITAQTCVLPSLNSYLATFHASTVMLGYCLSATYMGELCTTKMFSSLLDNNAREPVIIGLIISAAGMVMYGFAPNAYVVLASRFLVGCGGGLQWGLLELASGQSESRNRSEALHSLRSGAYTLAFILGMGMAAVASFVHMSPAGGLGNIHRALPQYVKSLGPTKPAKEADIGSMASFTLGSMEITPNHKHRRMLLATKPKTVPAKNKGPGAEVVGMIGSAGKAMSKDVNAGIRAASKTISHVGSDIHAVSRVTDHDLGIGTIHVGGAPPVQTDSEISRRVGKHMYMPSYLTAVVGHGMAAPAYMSALLSVCAAVLAFRVLPKTPPRKTVVASLPASMTGPRALRPLMPMAGLVVLELLAQVSIVVTETIVSSTTSIYFGWMIDASAVFMLGMAAAGVVGLAVAEAIRARVRVRRILVVCAALVAGGFAACVPLGGNLHTWQYGLGCFACAFAAAPMSLMSVRIFTAGAARIYGEDSEAGWLVWLWHMTGTPARLVVPIALGYAMEKQGAAPSYIGLTLFSVLCFVLFLHMCRSSEATWSEADDAAEGARGPSKGTLSYSVLRGGSVESSTYGSFPANH